MATLIVNRGHERDYRIQDGRLITLIYDDQGDRIRISFKERNERLGGEFLFFDQNETGESYLLGRMYCPIKQNGLGQAAVEYVKEQTNAKIYTRPNDGEVLDDGSHLTEDAPLFVGAMQRKGLIENWTEDAEWDDDRY